ncbi:MAG: nitroreductase family protein [Thermoguttaceae bacterium]|nr:nitroreductase family protein [Thermoguttaceae bacterium]
MEFFETVARRRCYRGEFTDAPVPREALTKILEAAIEAPTACNAQSPSFVAVDDPAVLAKIAEIMPTPVCKTAKAVIVCVADERPVYADVSFYKEDCSAAVQNMLLALTALGFHSVWLDGVLRRDGIAEKIARLLQIPEGKRVQIVLPIGVAPSEPTKAERLPFEKRASFNVWKDQQ